MTYYFKYQNDSSDWKTQYIIIALGKQFQIFKTDLQDFDFRSKI